jgi:sorbitol-specific phosphotransferase system component IIC
VVHVDVGVDLGLSGHPLGNNSYYFVTPSVGSLLLCHPMTMTCGTIYVYDLWA